MIQSRLGPSSSNPERPGSLRGAFDREGFVRVPEAIDAAQVAELRRQLAAIFDKPSSYEGDINGHPNYKRAYFDAFNRYPELRWIAFHPPIVAALRELLGSDFVYLPEVGIHDSGYGGWHKDSTSQEAAGLRFHWEPDFRMVQCALYLQDNDRNYAGGLDVAVGSHLRRDRIVRPGRGPISKLAGRALYRLKTWDDQRRGTTLSTGAGDLVIFHYRLDHKATSPRLTPVPESHRKFALFMAASANNRHAASYVRYIKTRPDYVYLKTYRTAPALLDMAAQANVRFAEP